MPIKVFIEWNDRYNTGHKVIDAQHRRLVDIINELYTAALDESANQTKAFTRAIRTAADYTAYHFSEEEKIMEAVNYSKISEHKKMHAYFLAQILAHVKLYEEGSRFIANQFIRFLRDWLLEHIALRDVEMVKEVAATLRTQLKENDTNK